MRNSFLDNIPPVCKNLIIINLIVWFASYLLASRGVFDINQTFGMHYWQAEKFNPTQLLTYMFLHQTVDMTGGLVFGHVVFNMFSLFMFGMVIERYWGGRRFLFYYLFCGLGAAVVQQIFWTIDFKSFMDSMNTALQHFPNDTERIIAHKISELNIPITIGASGAVFGILLAFGWLFPQQKMFLIFLPIPIPARIFVAIYAVIELVGGVANFRFDNIAHFAHLGGMFFGLLLILWWKHKHKFLHNS